MKQATASQKSPQEMARESGFPPHLPPREPLTWDEVVDEIKNLVLQSTRSGGETRVNEVTPDTASSSPSDCCSDSQATGANPSPVRDLELWEALLDSEFPPYLPPSGELSLETLQQQELEALHDDEGAWL